MSQHLLEIPPHPLDLRTMRLQGDPAAAPGSKTIEELLAGKSAAQETDALLQREIGDRLRPDLPDYILVIDGLANGLAEDLHRPSEPKVSTRINAVIAWYESATTAERQRFAIGFEQHYQHHALSRAKAVAGALPTDAAAPDLEIAHRLRDRIITAADVLPVLPTIDRIYGATENEDLLGPTQTAELRAAGWHDAAGRDIDTCLLMGAAYERKVARAMAPLAPRHDLAAASWIDRALRSLPYPLDQLLSEKGIILSPGHRQALIAMAQHPGELGSNLPKEALSPDNLIDGREYLLECLSLDRANRLFAEEQPARRATPAEPHWAPTL